MRTYFTLVLLGLTLASASLKGQEHYDRTVWAPIERDLNFRNNYGELGIRLNAIFKDAVKVNDVINTARALYTLNRLHDRQYEDTLFFFNSRYQDSIILQPQADVLLKTIMLHLKARRIAEFRQNHSARPRAALYRSYMPGEDYAKMTSAQLDSLSNLYFAKAISLSTQAGQPDIKRLTWITADPYGLLYKPKLSDFIYLEQVTAKAGAMVIQAKQLPQNWIQAPLDGLVRSKVIDSSIGALYASWINSRSDDPSAQAFIDLQFRRSLFNKAQQQDQQAFEDYLYAKTKSVYAPVRASAVYQLCMLWTAGRATERYEKSSRAKRTTYKKAIELYASAKPLLDSFAILDAALTNMVSELTATYYSISSNSKHQPYRTSIAELEYRNINKLYLRVIKLRHGDRIYDGSFTLPAELLAYPVVKDTMINLPAYGDYNIHSAYLMLTPLPPGRYTWLFSDQPIDTNNVLHLRAVTVNVSNITTVPMFGRMYVLKSDSGFPLESAKVKMVYKPDKEEKLSWHTVNKDGWVPMKNNDLFYAEVYDGEDTDMLTTVPTYRDYNDNVYVKDEYDSRAEYYDDNLYMKVFTDRSIYRPGQQVFFKGIVFTRDLRTGEEVILNWDNLKLPFYQKWLSRMGQKFANEKIDMVLTDAFNKPVDTLTVKPNKYGSFSGTFTIPKQAPTGNWNIESDWYDITNGGESFKVEEYKKPTMFLQLEQPAKTLRPGDSIPVVVKVKSFTGADLDDVEVDINISAYVRTGNFKMDTTIISKKGSVKMFIIDSLGRSLRDSVHKESITYRINVSALNTEGETVKDRYALWPIVDARGYHLKAYPADSLLRRMADSLLSKYDGLRSLMSEAEYIIMLKQWYPEGSRNAQVAEKRLESLRQQAVNDPKNGMRWKEVADDEDLSISHEETVARLAEAFSYSPYGAEVQQGIVQWLLQNRKEHSWGSTKATAQVVGLLAAHAKDPMQAITVEADGLKVSNDLFSGKLSAYWEAQTFPATMTVTASQATKLGVNYYYLSSTAPTPVRQDLRLNRQLFYYDDSIKNWRLVEGKTILRVGQRVRVELEIFTAKMLQYVTIQDRRAASFDVPGLTSGYKWGKDLSYYQSVRDASMQFFASRIPAGRTMIRYEMVVSKEGVFSHGHASLSCMYNPDRTAHSESSRITVK